jgi:uncharacterized protein with LGFP repeats
LIAGASPRRAFAVRLAIESRYRSTGGPQGPWGYPTSHTERVDGARRGMTSRFQHVTAFWSEATGTHWLNGRIRTRYRYEGGPAGHLGFPTSDVEQIDPETQRVTFENGVITYNSTTGELQVVPPGP